MLKSENLSQLNTLSIAESKRSLFGSDSAEGVKPVVTIVTVVFNQAELLEETIRSVLALNDDTVAYIVIDGGSHDGTVDVIRKYTERIAWWTSEPDNGIYDAMNKGWAAAPESFILFLGAGDHILSLPSNISELSRQDIIYGDVLLEGRLFHGNAGLGLKCNNTLHHQALLIHKTVHPEPPFDTKFKVYADFDFNQRLLKQGSSFVYSSSLQAYAAPGGASSRKAHLETLRVVRKNFGLVWCLLALCYLLWVKMLKTATGQ